MIWVPLAVFVVLFLVMDIRHERRMKRELEEARRKGRSVIIR